MEIDEFEYLNLGLSEPIGQPEVVHNGSVYTKRTLLQSPVFCNIIPQFHVQPHKKIRSVRNLSLQDDSMQYAAFQEEDSQFGVFSDDEMMFDVGDDLDSEDAVVAKGEDTKASKLRVIRVIVRNTSIVANDRSFATNSPIRSSCILKGIRNDQVQEEDSLLVSLKSGFLLLVRFFWVPASFIDTDGNCDVDSDASPMAFKPFVVQWWDTSSKLASPSIFSSGASLATHTSGLAAVSTAFSGGFRIFNCDHTENGVFLQKHYTVPIDGTILHSCFAQPLKGSILDNHVMFLAMVYTNDSRLRLDLYGWMTLGPIHTSLTKSTLPLEGGFTPPVFVVSLGSSGSFLFVTPTELIIITVHDITSAEYTFRRTPFPGSFPTSYYCPETEIVAFGDQTRDEVLISTNNGVIYSVIVQNNEIHVIKPVVRISDPISVFSLETASSGNDEGYELVYGSTVGLNRVLFIRNLLPDIQDGNVPYSESFLTHNFKNWAPMLDTQVIDAYKSKNSFQSALQELWCISGFGKRARLSHLRYGLLNTRIGDSFPSLRKTEGMKWLEYNGSAYIACSTPFDTTLLEFSHKEGQGPELIEIDDACIASDTNTLAFGVVSTVSEALVVQVTAKSVILTTLDEIIITRGRDGAILFADICDDLIVVARLTGLESQFSVEVFKVSESGEPDEPMSQDQDPQTPKVALDLVASIVVGFDVSFAKLFKVTGEPVIVLGSFDGLVRVQPLGGQFQDLELSQVVDQKDKEDNMLVPHDAAVTNNGTTLIIGTKDGYLFYFAVENLSLSLEKYYRLSEIAVVLHSSVSEQDSQRIYAVCGSLWVLDFAGLAVPEPVLSEEKNDKPIKSICPVPVATSHRSASWLIIVRDDGLAVSKLSTSRQPAVKQINLGESAKKLTYLTQTSMFAIISHSQNRNARLRFVDRKTYKLLPHSEFNSKNKRFDNGESIFEEDELPSCLKVWSLDKLGRISKKLLVGCNSTNTGKGIFKILDVAKTTASDNRPMVKLTLLNSFEHPSSIGCIEQLDSTIFFSSGKSLYSTSYNLDEKRLNPVASLVTLSSDIINITSEATKTTKSLTITTKLDSVFQFDFKSGSSYKECLQLRARDPAPKSVVNHAVLGAEVIVSDRIHSDIVVMEKASKDFVPRARFKSFGVPRVLGVNMNCMWEQGSGDATGILVVTVDGEVTLLKEIAEDSAAYDDLKKVVPMKVDSDGGRLFSLERWDIPFQDKVGGKGFKSLNKSYFRNVQNRKGLIDYDLGEIARSCHSYSGL